MAWSSIRQNQKKGWEHLVGASPIPPFLAYSIYHALCLPYRPGACPSPCLHHPLHCPPPSSLSPLPLLPLALPSLLPASLVATAIAHVVAVIAVAHPPPSSPSPSLLPPLPLPSLSHATPVAVAYANSLFVAADIACPPPLLPSPLSSLSQLPLLACHPCPCCHRLAALALFVACHPQHQVWCKRG
jgi:hypothetical protein